MKKGLIVGIIGAAALAIATAVSLFLTQRSTEPESVRSIKVIDLGGTCTVLRNGETLTVGKDMDLYTDDVVGVSEDGFARIRLDDDKFLYLDAGAIIDISATGTAEVGDTQIYVYQGEIMAEVKNKLSSESSFTVVTSNTAMYVTGTILTVGAGEGKISVSVENSLREVVVGSTENDFQTNSNAILQGSAVVEAFKENSDGTVISAKTTLSAGEGNSFTTSSGEALSIDELRNVLRQSKNKKATEKENVNDRTLLDPSDGGIVFGSSQFSESFMTNVANVILADADAQDGEVAPDQATINRARGVLNSIDAVSGIGGQSIWHRVHYEKYGWLGWDGSTESTGPETAVDRSKQATTAVAAVETPKKDTDGWMKPDDGIPSGLAQPSVIKLQLPSGAKLPPVIDEDRDDSDSRVGRIPYEELQGGVIENDDKISVTNRPKEEEKKEEEKKEEKEEEKKDDTTITETDDGHFFYVSYISYEGLSQTIIKNDNPVNLHLIFCRKDANGEWQEDLYYSLPSKIPTGTVLPGIETPDVTPDIFIDVADENNQYAGYVFTGWYKSKAGAESSDAQDKIEKVPDGSGNLTVYAGIAEEPNHDVSENDPINAVSGNE